MNINRSIILLITILPFQSFAAYTSLDYDEQWQGTLLWAKAEGVVIPDAHLDAAKWVACFPGSWDKPMVMHSMVYLANCGITNFYWDVVNEYGMVLYPSIIAKDKVYRNENSGVDFSKTDMVQKAIDAALSNAINLTLVVHFSQGNARQFVDELLKMYPEVKVAVVDSNEQYKSERVGLVTKAKIESMLDVTDRDKNPTKLKDYSGLLVKKYLHSGKVLFRREFTVFDKKDRCLMAVGAHEKWTVFVNGKLMGGGQWYGGKFQDETVWSHTYELNDVVVEGKNVIVVCAESTSSMRSFIANIRTGDMIYPCDGSWQAAIIDETPTQENIDEIMDGMEGNWKPALRMGGAVTACGKIFWNRIND